jgi:hypothetical protein
MEILKQAEDSPFFIIKDLDEDVLIGMYNTCLNYKEYIKKLLRLSDSALIQVAPGLSSNVVRANLKQHLFSCESFIEAWDNLLNASQTAKQN